MESQREVERKYILLMKDVSEKEYYTRINLDNRVNCYGCSCGNIFKTKDIDPGCTPATKNCPRCGGMAWSTGYHDVLPNENPVGEWYRPTLKECMKYRNDPGILDHVFRGGLLYREI